MSTHVFTLNSKAFIDCVVIKVWEIETFTSIQKLFWFKFLVISHYVWENTSFWQLRCVCVCFKYTRTQRLRGRHGRGRENVVAQGERGGEELFVEQQEKCSVKTRQIAVVIKVCVCVCACKQEQSNYMTIFHFGREIWYGPVERKTTNCGPTLKW